MTTVKTITLDILSQIQEAVWELSPEDRATLIRDINGNTREFQHFIASQMELLEITPNDDLAEQIALNLRNKFRE